MLAAQDQGLATRATLHLLKKHESPRYRFCGQPAESPNHLLSHCQNLMTQGEYLKTHNKVCHFIYWNILGYYNIKRNNRHRNINLKDLHQIEPLISTMINH